MKPITLEELLNKLHKSKSFKEWSKWDFLIKKELEFRIRIEERLKEITNHPKKQ